MVAGRIQVTPLRSKEGWAEGGLLGGWTYTGHTNPLLPVVYWCLELSDRTMGPAIAELSVRAHDLTEHVRAQGQGKGIYRCIPNLLSD